MHNNFKQELMELNSLWEQYVSTPKEEAKSIELLEEYHKKLNKIAKWYGLSMESVDKYARNNNK